MRAKTFLSLLPLAPLFSCSFLLVDTFSVTCGENGPLPRCDGDALITCEEGLEIRTTCRQGEVCVPEEGACLPAVKEICDNLQDDDGDDFIDCEDPDCADFPECGVISKEVCGNFADDDGDGFIDCGDREDCEGSGLCGQTPTGEPCFEGSECGGGICFPEQGSGFPSGYCSEPCSVSQGLCAIPDAAGELGVCANVFQDPNNPDLGACFSLCDIDDQNGCRPGYACTEAEGQNQGVCLPACTSDQDCPQSNVCDASTGLCLF